MLIPWWTSMRNFIDSHSLSLIAEFVFGLVLIYFARAISRRESFILESYSVKEKVYILSLLIKSEEEKEFPTGGYLANVKNKILYSLMPDHLFRFSCTNMFKKQAITRLALFILEEEGTAGEMKSWLHSFPQVWVDFIDITGLLNRVKKMLLQN